MGIAEELKQSHFQTEATKAIVNVIYTGNWIIQRQQEMFKPFGVTMQQYNVLRILKGQQGKPMTVLAITERMLDRMSNASRLVDKLLEKQLVERRQCPNDRRAVDIVILPAGLALLEQMEGDLKKLGQKIEVMGNENLIQLNELLDQFRTRIS